MGSDQRFPTTSWSTVLRAAEDAEAPQSAMERLCTDYWPPVYVYVRSHIADVQEAEDLTQAFFLNLIEHKGLSTVRPDVSRFRWFLLAAVRHFLSNEKDRARALKRGGGRLMVSLDAAPDYPLPDPTDTAIPPDLIFERNWAHLLLSRALASLRSTYEQSGRTEEFEALKGCLSGDAEHVLYADIAVRLGTTESAIKMSVHRLRRRFAESLRAEIAETVADPADIDDEMRYLLSVVAA